MADLSMYESREMVQALEQMKEPSSFLLDTFFGSAPQRHNTHTIDIDIVDKMGRELAVFVSPVMEGKVVKDKGYSTKSFKIPYLKEKMVDEAIVFLNRQPGEQYFGSASPEERASMKLGEELATLRNRFLLREEWMASKGLTEGKIQVSGDGVATQEIDFQMKNSHLPTLTGGDLWSATTSDPIQDLEDWANLVAQDSGIYPDVVVLGASAWASLRKHELFLKYLDNRNIRIGEQAPALMAPGVQFVANLPSVGAGVKVYTYAEFYADPATGNATKFIPDAKVVMGSTKARTKRHYGAVVDLKAGVNAVDIRWFAKSWEQEDPSVRWVMLQGAPLVAIHQPDAFLCATVV